MEGTDMISKQSKELLNKFHSMSLGNTIRRTNADIVKQINRVNARFEVKDYTFRATVPGYFVEWFYNQNNKTYVYISGVTNGIVFLETGDSEKLCDTIDCMLGIG
nr:MAG TPA: hypothetical protein [Caudoviricetes sp.]